MTRSRSPSPTRRSAPPPPIYLPQYPAGPIQTGGIDDRRTEPEKPPPPGPIQTGGIDDRRTETTHEFDDQGARKPSSSVVIVPTYPHNRRYSSSSSSDCFCSIVGNLILRVLCIIFIAIVVLLFLALSVYHVATKGVSFPKTVDVEVNVVPVPDPRWNGLYNGTYLAVGGSGRFSSRSASSSTSSVAYKFALAEHQFRIDRKVDPYDGRPYFEFKSRPVTASDYVRRLRFFSGEPFSLVIRADDWESSTRATITVQRELWREYYPGSPNLEVEREFLADGVISVTYSAAEVIYYKKFKRLLFS